MASTLDWPRSPPSRASRPRGSRARLGLLGRAGSTSSSPARRVEGAAQLAVLHARGDARVDGASSAAKSSGIVVCVSGAPTTLRARSGWISSLREVRLSTTWTSSSSRTCSRRQRSRRRRTPRSATTSGVVTTSTVPAISAPIALASETCAPRSTTVSA